MREHNEVANTPLLLTKLFEPHGERIGNAHVAIQNDSHLAQLESVGGEHHDALETLNVGGIVQLAVIGHELARPRNLQQPLLVVVAQRAPRDAREPRHLAGRHRPCVFLAHQLEARLRFLDHSQQLLAYPARLPLTADEICCQLCSVNLDVVSWSSGNGNKKARLAQRR